MIITGLSWVYISAVICSVGLIVTAFFSRVLKYRIQSLSSVMMTGIVGTTVYAEAFSLIYKVGAVALLVLNGLCIIGMIIERREIKRTVTIWIERLKGYNRITLRCLFAIIVSYTVLGSYLASRTPSGYDEYNYHIQSIRWMEEYGVVKGLGNLHTRFGYNSSFLCLQALFSFSWLLPMSMHSMNGFIWVFVTVFCTVGFCWIEKRRFRLSDLLRILCVFLLFQPGEMQRTAGPNTDFFPLCITAFVFIQWCKLIEKKENDAVPYGLLSMLGLFGATAKLSAGVLFLFAVRPLFQCFREKRYDVIWKFCIIGIAIFVPFLVRNVILTGYLLYPMASIDLFQVDWKIPKSVIVSDNAIIKLFARGNGGDYRYEYWTRPFTEWVRIWVQTSGSWYNALGVADLFLAIFVLLKGLFNQIRRKAASEYSDILLMAAVGILFLFVTAPSTRFGIWWFFLLPLVLLYTLFQTIAKRIHKDSSKKAFTGNTTLAFSCMIVLMCVGLFVAISVKSSGGKIIHRLITPSDYEMTGADSQYRIINGKKFYFYTPNSGYLNHLNGYDGFPGTEVLYTLARIEMRGENLQDGFKPREEYQDIAYDFQGRIMTPDAIRAIGLDKYYDAEKMSDYDDSGYYNLLFSEKREIDIKDYSIQTGKLRYVIDQEIQEDGKTYTITGWAYIPDNEDKPTDPESCGICVLNGENIYIGYSVNRKDIALKEKTERYDIGFVIYTAEKISGELCIVDFDHKIIYK